jgi:hypothetical protein
VNAAKAAGSPAAAEPALDFVRSRGLRDVRVNAAATASVASR